MRARHLYLALCLIGTLLPLGAFLPFLGAPGTGPRLFVQQLFATPVSAFFGWDVIVSSLVLSTFVLVEGRRLALGGWAPILAEPAGRGLAGTPAFSFIYGRFTWRARATIPPETTMTTPHPIPSDRHRRRAALRLRCRHAADLLVLGHVRARARLLLPLGHHLLDAGAPRACVARRAARLRPRPAPDAASAGARRPSRQRRVTIVAYVPQRRDHQGPDHRSARAHPRHRLSGAPRSTDGRAHLRIPGLGVRGAAAPPASAAWWPGWRTGIARWSIARTGSARRSLGARSPWARRRWEMTTSGMPRCTTPPPRSGSAVPRRPEPG